MKKVWGTLSILVFCLPVMAQDLSADPGTHEVTRNPDFTEEYRAQAEQAREKKWKDDEQQRQDHELFLRQIDREDRFK